jgi:hypothetical protein
VKARRTIVERNWLKLEVGLVSVHLAIGVDKASCVLFLIFSRLKQTYITKAIFHLVSWLRAVKMMKGDPIMLPRPKIIQDKDAKTALAGGLAVIFLLACIALADDCPEIVTKSGGHCCSTKCLASDMPDMPGMQASKAIKNK